MKANLFVAAVLLSMASTVCGQDFLVFPDGTIRKVIIQSEPSDRLVTFKERTGGNIIQIPSAEVEQIIHGNRNPPSKARATIGLTGGRSITGNILYADSSGLMMFGGGEEYFPGNSDNHVKFIPCNEIDLLELDRKGKPGKGALIGATTGAIIGFMYGATATGFFSGPDIALGGAVVLGATSGLVGAIAGAASAVHTSADIKSDPDQYLKSLNLLKQHALLKTPPPEYKNKISFVVGITPRDGQAAAASDSLLSQGSPMAPGDSVSLSNSSTSSAGPNEGFKKSMAGKANKIHISLTYGFIIGGPALSMKRAMEKSGYGETVNGWFGPVDFPIKSKGGGTMNFGLDVDMLPAWRAGINFNKIDAVEIKGRSLSYVAFEEAHRTSWELMMTRVKHPYRKNFTSRSEWAFGAGVSVNTLLVNGYLPAYYRLDTSGNLTETGPYRRSFQKVQPGLVLRLTYDTYLLKNFSLHFRLEPRIMNAIEVEEVEGYRPLKAHRVNFSSLSTSVGLRVHL